MAPGSTVCDIGGGNGHAVLNLLRTFHHFKAIVQDTPAVAEESREVGDSIPLSYILFYAQLH
jgi:hypothetical protein